MGLLDIFRGTKGNSSHNDPQRPRLHHYEFAYRALPGLAFADPYGPLGMAHDTPKGSLVKFWNHVETQIPKRERVSDSGLIAVHAPFGPDYVIVLVTMPTPLRVSEAYFVGIIYPKSWFNSPDRENSSPALNVFILSKSDVPGAGGSSGGTLRRLNQTGHGAVKFGVAANVETFVNEIQTALLNPNKWITWVDSKPWDILMLDAETGQTQAAARIIEPPTQVTKPHGKLLIVDGEDGPRESMRVIFQDEYKLFLAEDGPDAIELVNQNDIDVVVMDTLAGKSMSGMEVLERLKILKPDIKVIVVTAFETNDTLRRALQLRASDYLNKPFDLATIRTAINKAMQSRTQARDIAAARKKSSNNLGITAQQPLFKWRGKLLVLDDEEGIRDSMCVIFENEYDLFITEDGPTAIRLAQENDVDVAVLDIHLARMSGIEVLRRLKTLKPDIEVIMMTGLESNDFIRDSLRLGACDFIYKPFDLATIKAAVGKAMQHQKVEIEGSATPKKVSNGTKTVTEQTQIEHHDKATLPPEEIAEVFFERLKDKAEAGFPKNMFPDEAPLGIELIKDEWIYFSVFIFDYSTFLAFGETPSRRAILNPFSTLVVSWLKTRRAPAVMEPRIIAPTFENAAEPPNFIDEEPSEPSNERLKRRVLTYSEALKTPCSLGQNYMVALTFASLCGVDSSDLPYVTGISSFFSRLKIEQTKILKSYHVVL
jgi:DNA-binding response OmpR family regulator